ncbi:MAG: CopG family antitoxin [Verrucomicrobiota bacterium]|jgi:predicted DNA binding CopG/RHH family protein
MKKNIRYVKEAKTGDWADADLSRARPVIFPNLKPTREPVSLRIPGITLDKIRCLANRRGIPYQSLINSWLTERAEKETKTA